MEIIELENFMFNTCTSFSKSVLFGSRGSYNFWGIQVKFHSRLKNNSRLESNIEKISQISSFAVGCLQSAVFQLGFQIPTHIFVQGISSALARKLFTEKISRVDICATHYISKTSFLSLADKDWKEAIINLAGPMGNNTFSICKLLTVAALKNYLPSSVSIALAGGSIVWMSSELIRSFVSVYKADQGYFDKIARLGHRHLQLATGALLAQTALGAFIAIKALQ